MERVKFCWPRVKQTLRTQVLTHGSWVHYKYVNRFFFLSLFCYCKNIKIYVLFPIHNSTFAFPPLSLPQKRSSSATEQLWKSTDGRKQLPSLREKKKKQLSKQNTPIARRKKWNMHRIHTTFPLHFQSVTRFNGTPGAAWASRSARGLIRRPIQHGRVGALAARRHTAGSEDRLHLKGRPQRSGICPVKIWPNSLSNPERRWQNFDKHKNERSFSISPTGTT